MMRFYDLPTVVTLSRLSYLIVGENLIIFLLQNRSLFSSIEESNNLEEDMVLDFDIFYWLFDCLGYFSILLKYLII